MAQQQRIGTHRTTVRGSLARSTLAVRYHQTDVVLVTHDKITLNTGGYFTNTTKTRMNQASNQFGLGFQVFQKNYQWFVEYKGQVINFNGDFITFDR